MGGKVAEQKRLYANRRRSEVTERSFAHMYETGGMRRLHLRGNQNILKRLLVHGAAFNLGLLMRKRHGAGKPRCQKGPISARIPSSFAPLPSETQSYDCEQEHS